MTGLRRYVHISFAVLGLIAAYVLSNLFEAIGGALSFSYSVVGMSVASLAAFLVAIVGTVILWRNEKVFGFAEEVAQELKKVTWPTYEETRTSTIVVLVMVVIFSLVLGFFDFIWSGITNALVQSLS